MLLHVGFWSAYICPRSFPVALPCGTLHATFALTGASCCCPRKYARPRFSLTSKTRSASQRRTRQQQCSVQQRSRSVSLPDRIIDRSVARPLTASRARLSGCVGCWCVCLCVAIFSAPVSVDVLSMKRENVRVDLSAVFSCLCEREPGVGFQ